MAHILLAEDDESLRKFLAAALVKAGHAVTDFGDGADAWTCVQQGPFDLLLTDIVMPGSVNGLALSRMARMRRQNLKVIYMTGYTIPGAEREALGPILHKPVEDTQLLSEVEQALASA